METAKNGWYDNIIFALIVATASGPLAAKLYFLWFWLQQF
jgi:hypothetical protein